MSKGKLYIFLLSNFGQQLNVNVINKQNPLRYK